MGGWNFIDRTNMRFGKLVAQKYLGNKKWLCHCDCGNDCDPDNQCVECNCNCGDCCTDYCNCDH